jgi:hypothetical protein
VKLHDDTGKSLHPGLDLDETERNGLVMAEHLT